ncbi:putative secreted protein (Por secretion system target) [Ulvibacter sp. MAR_2010_11]|uniref:T9SS type A sorting domain-containing protein n=1 Tax=Ulvibacter sp. MAR_2010_11 TaxID=1250229 RepID=UPI000C2B5FD8|nr:T9SS type A sorting domain-containing protein [Ulvibacter sp. MAR_2010_11]PKA82276.1 putative secreted protein (Por secretion system target) [Ulvibacter sp. MAR_2010_11]
MKRILLLILFLIFTSSSFTQSIARQWNEEVLNGIRNDFARPTVHARNLFHSSVLMYDVWSVFDGSADTFFLGKTVGNYTCPFSGFSPTESISESRQKAMSFAVYRLMMHRFKNSPRKELILPRIEALMENLGYNTANTATNYDTGDAAALGNYAAAQMIAFGMQDGANEGNDYEYQFYNPINEPLNTDVSGNPDITDPNHWQPLKVEAWVDQSGNTIPGGQPPFLGPEWGAVTPFSLKEEDKTTYSVSGHNFDVYHDPGNPWYIQEGMGIDDPYKWGFALVAAWGSHLDPADTTMIDISPRSLGNFPFEDFPTNFDGFKSFYDFQNGGTPDNGRDVNPVTGLPYEEQLVKRGDYTRVLAEFWADGPESETPPGHWFTILNYVSDHPQLQKKFKGEGRVMDDLEWDVKSYFILGGTMHDVAVTAWGIKGYYDYVRPISAIRYMADRGQSSDPTEPSYNPHGLPLIPGYIEVIKAGDPLVGAFEENLGKMKLYTWRGPDRIIDPSIDIAGVGWIIANEWFPYQRPSFVTPPFAGYISGHSTFSRAASEVLTLLTGDEYFPGGMGTFDIPKDEFLKFEKGPSTNFQLQWATYRDASDQTSLSRIWGGIHPPIDDIPGRILGEEIGLEAFTFAETYFTKKIGMEGVLYPNPANEQLTVFYETEVPTNLYIYDILRRIVIASPATFDADHRFTVDVSALSQGMYFVVLQQKDKNIWVQKLMKD